MTDDPATAGTPPSDQPNASDRPAGGVPSPPVTATGTLVAPPPPPPATTGTGDPGGPTPPGAAEAPRRPGAVGLPVALGVGLLAAAITLSTMRSRADDDLDWSTYTVGLGATAALLLVAVAAAVIGRGRGREELVTWPGALGILGAGAMLGVGLEDVGTLEDALPYVVGGVILVLAVVGYAAVRRGAFVVTAIIGFGLIYGQVYDDAISDLGDEDDAVIVVAAAIAVFVLLVTAVGWMLRTRALSGVFAGVVGVVAYNLVLIVLVAARAIDEAFGDFAMEGEGAEEGPADVRFASQDLDNDVYVILAFAALLTLVWALAAALNGNPGFTVLAIAMPATIVPTATFVLAVEHPTWWGVGLGAAGAILLGIAGVLQLRARRRTT